MSTAWLRRHLLVVLDRVFNLRELVAVVEQPLLSLARLRLVLAGFVLQRVGRRLQRRALLQPDLLGREGFDSRLVLQLELLVDPVVLVCVCGRVLVIFAVLEVDALPLAPLDLLLDGRPNDSERRLSRRFGDVSESRCVVVMEVPRASDR